MSDVSRKEKIIEHDFGFLSLAGGKYTTFRNVGEKVAKIVTSKLFPDYKFYSMTKNLPLYSGSIKNIDEFIQTHYKTDLKICSIREESYRHLIEIYGHNYLSILHILSENESYIDHLPNSKHLKGEVVYAIRHEIAQVIDDFMRRRTTISLEIGKNKDCINAVADIFQSELGWSDSEKENQISLFERQYADWFWKK